MIQFYFDVHVHDVVHQALINKGVSILRAQDDGMGEAIDEELLERATELDRVLVTHDKDFLIIARNYQEWQKFFYGIIFSRPLQITIKNLLDDLLLISQAAKAEELHNLVTYLPL